MYNFLYRCATCCPLNLLDDTIYHCTSFLLHYYPDCLLEHRADLICMLDAASPCATGSNGDLSIVWHIWLGTKPNGKLSPGYLAPQSIRVHA